METNTRKCPFCAEEIKSEAIKCKHCGEKFDEKEINKNQSIAKEKHIKTGTLLSIGLLISYFLPWYTISELNFNGYEIPIYLNKFNSLKYLTDIDTSILKASYILFLIPICSIFNIIKDITNINGGYLLNEFAIGLLLTFILYIILSSTGLDYTINLSIGYYLTLLFSIIGLIYSSRLIQDILTKHNQNTKTNE